MRDSIEINKKCLMGDTIVTVIAVDTDQNPIVENEQGELTRCSIDSLEPIERAYVGVGFKGSRLILGKVKKNAKHAENSFKLHLAAATFSHVVQLV